MANQPGYQVPGQSNTAPQDSGSYYQNQISGSGYGSGQGFFGGGGPQTAQSQQAQGAGQGFTPMLGGQFQAPQVGQFNPQLGSPPPSPQSTFQGDLSGEKPSGQAFTEPQPQPAGAQPTSYNEAKALAQDPNSGVTEVPDSRGYSGSPTYQYVDANGNTVHLRPGGDGPVMIPKQMTFQDLTAYQSPTDQYRQAVMARDVMTPIQQALRSQLQGLAQERGGAVQQLQSQQRGLGMSGLAGLDLAGVGRQYAQTAGDIRTGAMQAMDDARRSKAAEVFQLGNQARQETGLAMGANRDFALSQIDMLQTDAQNMTGGGSTVMANQNLVNELRQLSNLAMTKAVSSVEFNALVSELMGRYGSYAFVAPDGRPMGAPGFELQGTAPKM